jgi:uncharacterized cupredoxin-like copper-binding protein
LASIGVLATALSGCAGSDVALAPAAGHMTATLQDFKLTTSTVDVPAGKVTFDVTNNGPSTHEFNVDRTTLAADKLPIDSTGLFVAESSPLLHREGSVESAGLGTRHRLTLNLAPGTYVVYCDLEGHYLSGMHVTINVH